MLETLDAARARGARILAELVGVSHNSDAYHITAPEPSGDSAARAMQKAIADAGLVPEEIEYICAHGTGTPLNDVSETRALKRVFGDYASRVPISSPSTTRSMLPGVSRLNTTIGTSLSMHSVSAVLSMTSMPRLSTSR